MPADNVWKCPRGICDFSSTSKPLVDAHCKEAKGRLLYICGGCRYTQCDASFEIFQSHLRNCEAGQAQLAPFSVEDRFRVRALMTRAVGDDLRAGSLRAIQFPVRSLRYPPWQAIRMPREGGQMASQAGTDPSVGRSLVPSSQQNTTPPAGRRIPNSLSRRGRGGIQKARPAQSRSQGTLRSARNASHDVTDLTGGRDKDLVIPKQDPKAFRARQDSGASFAPAHGGAVKQYQFVYKHPELDGLQFTYDEDIEESELGVDYPGEMVFDYSRVQAGSAVDEATQTAGEDDEVVDWKAFGVSIFGTGNGSTDEHSQEHPEADTGGYRVTDAGQSLVDRVENAPASRVASPMGSEADAPGETDAEYEAWFKSGEGE